uniref:Ovule protein n=1 Tax=Caenorhabditis tropicalis TaxID=1561998 RepID=A0A1I7TYA8_9PELO
MFCKNNFLYPVPPISFPPPQDTQLDIFQHVPSLYLYYVMLLQEGGGLQNRTLFSLGYLIRVKSILL